MWNKTACIITVGAEKENRPLFHASSVGRDQKKKKKIDSCIHPFLPRAATKACRCTERKSPESSSRLPPRLFHQIRSAVQNTTISEHGPKIFLFFPTRAPFFSPSLIHVCPIFAPVLPHFFPSFATFFPLFAYNLQKNKKSTEFREEENCTFFFALKCAYIVLAYAHAYVLLFKWSRDPYTSTRAPLHIYVLSPIYKRTMRVFPLAPFWLIFLFCVQKSKGECDFTKGSLDVSRSGNNKVALFEREEEEYAINVKHCVKFTKGLEIMTFICPKRSIHHEAIEIRPTDCFVKVRVNGIEERLDDFMKGVIFESRENDLSYIRKVFIPPTIYEDIVFECTCDNSLTFGDNQIGTRGIMRVHLKKNLVFGCDFDYDVMSSRKRSAFVNFYEKNEIKPGEEIVCNVKITKKEVYLGLICPEGYKMYPLTCFENVLHEKEVVKINDLVQHDVKLHMDVHKQISFATFTLNKNENPNSFSCHCVKDGDDDHASILQANFTYANYESATGKHNAPSSICANKSTQSRMGRYLIVGVRAFVLRLRIRVFMRTVYPGKFCAHCACVNERALYTCGVNECAVYTCGVNESAVYTCGVNECAVYACGVNECAVYACGVNECAVYTCGVNECVVYTCDVH
ncbi:6-cysteine protein (P12p) [Plasmodium ovale wallikeri]|uniref:6-cysteine protein (P12p) n=1 Tax=Plasmodium ovale wallikeri TaxID=864142 RepID=A0A1A8Z4M2_PLAOA|nr:6-cysteine protein (P12p) [Plasmodium ovale wallikeri]